MNAADYLVKTLINYGVTDVFGVPGGVVLDFLYAIEKEKSRISAHLCYHEQGAAFAAVGYAQVNGTLGVAYATRGPGFTNLITGIAEAYQESIPVLFISSHGQDDFSSKMRMTNNQELDTIPIVKSITKYAVRIENIEDFRKATEYACNMALKGRKGPVFIDVASSLWNMELCCNQTASCTIETNNIDCNVAEEIRKMLNEAQRPIILAGAGIHLSNTVSIIRDFSERHNIPIISSRGSQDLFADSDMYFGYIGSHATRYSNFILSKADLILSLGNRMAFPIDSKSFGLIFETNKTIRIDIDELEFERKIPNCRAYRMDLKLFFDKFRDESVRNFGEDWIGICRTIKSALYENDIEYPVELIAELMKIFPADSTFVSDVGNNEFWVSRAYAYAHVNCRILYSRAFGSLGNALPKAIGAYYRTKKPVVCFVGDQGLQFNMQELQTLSQNNLPITIVLLNNHSSGMIRSHELRKYGYNVIHTTTESGYGTPNFNELCCAYGIEHTFNKRLSDKPLMIEIDISEDVDLIPYIPVGAPCQNMSPQIDVQLYDYLNSL